MRILGLAAAGLILAGPAFAQTSQNPAVPALAGAPPSPYAAPAASADALGGAGASTSANANLYGTPAASVGGTALGGVMQTFDTFGAVRNAPPVGTATQAMAGPRLGAAETGVSSPALDPTPAPAAKSAKSKTPR